MVRYFTWKLELVSTILQLTVGFAIRIVHKKTPYSDVKGVADQEHLTENLMNKLLNLYCISLEQNVD